MITQKSSIIRGSQPFYNHSHLYPPPTLWQHKSVLITTISRLPYKKLHTVTSVRLVTFLCVWVYCVHAWYTCRAQTSAELQGTEVRQVVVCSHGSTKKSIGAVNQCAIFPTSKLVFFFHWAWLSGDLSRLCWFECLCPHLWDSGSCQETWWGQVCSETPVSRHPQHNTHLRMVGVSNTFLAWNTCPQLLT